MNLKKIINALCGLSLTALIPLSLEATKVVGYYENWAIYNQNGANAPYNTTPSTFSPVAGKIDVLNYAFATFNENLSNGYSTDYTYVPTNDWAIYLSDPNDYQAGAYDGTNYTTPLLNQAFNLKQINPSLKVVLSIGGWNFTQGKTQAPTGPGQYGYYTAPFFSLMANDQSVNTQTNANNPYEGGASINNDLNYRYGNSTYVLSTQGTRAKFIASAVRALSSDNLGQNQIGSYNSTGFDGLDLDWEYPGRLDRGGLAGDYNGLLAVLTGIRNELATNSISGKILSMATPSGASLTTAQAGVAGTPAIATVSWSAGTFSDGTTYPSSATVISAGITSNLTFTAPSGTTYSYASDNEKLYFAWLTICAYECDYFNVMTYDYYGSTYFPAYDAAGDPLNSELAPLYVDPASNPVTATNQEPPCVDRTIGMYLNAGIPAIPAGGGVAATPAISMPKNKINMGIPAYGRGFNNPNPAATGQGYYLAPVPGSLWLPINGQQEPTVAQPCSKQPGYFNYYEMTSSSSGTGQHFTAINLNETSQTTYATSAYYGCFLSFDGAGNVINGKAIPNTVLTKANYIKNAGLGGVMIWALDCDDTVNGFPVLTQAATCVTSTQTQVGPSTSLFGQQSGNNNTQ